MQIEYVAGDRELLNQVIIRFYLADKAVGAKGFKAIWTEIKVNFVAVEKLGIVLSQDQASC